MKIVWNSEEAMRNAAKEVLDLKEGLFRFLDLIVANLPAEYERVGIDGWEEWLLKERAGLRYRLRILKNRKNYVHDSHIRVDQFRRRIEYCFYAAVCGWDKKRSRQPYDYLRQAVDSVAELAQPRSSAVLKYQVGVGRWDGRGPVWKGPIEKAPELKSQLDASFRPAVWDHSTSEMAITHEIGLGEMVGNNESWGPSASPLTIDSEKVDLLAQSIAKGFQEFVQNLEPLCRRLDTP